LLKVITAYKSTPFARRVKQETKLEHDTIESHPFIRSLITGEIKDLSYAAYLHNLLSVYATIEGRLFDKDTLSELFRSSLITQDICKYKTLLNCDFNRYNFWEQWIDNIRNGDEYVTAANFYIRWLGDMYGGQIMAKNFKFSSMLKFKDVRKCIREARKIIENIGSKNPDLFIERVKQAYAFNYKLADDLRNSFDEISI
jgi:heme oxygenase